MTAPGGVIATVYVKILPQVRDFAKNLRQSLRASQRDLRSLDRELKLVEVGFRRIGRVVTGLVPGLRLTRQSMLALAAKSIAGGIIASASAVSTLTGVLITLPAVGAAGASAMGALTVGLFGVSKALDKFANKEKFDELLKDLSKNAQSTLGVINEFRDELTEFKNSVQDRLFAGLDDVARGLVTTFLPRLTTHFGNLADIINLSVKDLAGFATSASTLRDFDEVTTNIEAGFSNLRGAVLPVARAIRDIVTVGSRSLPSLADEVVSLATKFADFIAITRATGQLQVWIQAGIAALKQFGQVIYNIGRSIVAIFGAARQSGNDFLAGMVEITDKVATFLESAKGQNYIKTFLDTANAAAKALAPVLGALADLLIMHVLPVFESFAKAVGPAVTQFFYALGDALDVAAPGIRAFAQGFAQFIIAITPVLPLIGQLVGQIGTLIGTMASGFGPAIAEVATTIGNLLLPVLQALTALFSVMPEGVLKFVVVVGTLVATLGVLLTIIRGAQTVIGLFAGGFELLAGASLKTEKGVKGLASFLGGPWGIAIGLAVTALGLLMSATDETQSDINSLAQAMEGATGSTEKATRAWVLQKLEQDGVAATADKLGISMNDLIDAYMGLPGAQERVTAQIARQGDVADVTTQEMEDFLREIRDGKDIVDAARAAQERKNDVDSRGIGIANLVTDSLKIQKGVLEALNQEKQREQDAALAATNSQLGYQSALLRATEQLKEHGTTLDINTQEGIDNLSVLTQLASAGQQRVRDLQNEKASTDVVNAAIQQNEDALLGLLQPFFATKEAARAYAEQVGLIPKAPVTKPVFDDADARARLENLKVALADLTRDRQINIRFNPIGNDLARLNLPTGGHPILTNAAGGRVGAGRWSWVGEEGPELVRFGTSGRVYSNEESMQMARDVGQLDAMTTRGTSRSTYAPQATAAGSAQPTQIVVQPQLTAKVYIGDREITDIVRVELTEHDKQLTRLIGNGTGKRR